MPLQSKKPLAMEEPALSRFMAASWSQLWAKGAPESEHGDQCRQAAAFLWDLVGSDAIRKGSIFPRC